MNHQPTKQHALRALFLICNTKLTEKAVHLFKAHHLPMYYQFHGQGTASSDIIDMLGLGNVSKSITMALVPQPYSLEIIQLLNTQLGLNKPNTGIAFTVPLTGINSPIMRIMDESLRKELQDTMEKEAKTVSSNNHHCLIIAAVNAGFSEEIVSVTKKAGAGGGTVLHARQVIGEDIKHFLGISIQEEKELILIIAQVESKRAIMQAVSENYGMRSAANGVVFSLPIDMMTG